MDEINLINNLLKKCDYPKRYYGRKSIEFDYESYRRSALLEIKMALIREYKKDPILVVEEFRSKVDNFACKTKNGTANFMFSTYYDIATDVLDQLIARR